jgi:hypothetical protein
MIVCGVDHTSINHHVLRYLLPVTRSSYRLPVFGVADYFYVL